MTQRTSNASVLATAISLALTAGVLAGCTSTSGGAQTAQTASVEKCYGINAQGKNDCKAGAHDCAGHATTERDPASFIALPAGLCSKIAGGTTKSG